MTVTASACRICGKLKVIKGRDVCDRHKNSWRGTGQHVMCGVCGLSQLDHGVGFPEHKSVTVGFRTARAAIHVNK